MKKILPFLIIFLSSCSSVERFLPELTPEFVKKYFEDEILLYNELPDFISKTEVSILWENDVSGKIEDEYSFLNIYKLEDKIYIPTNEREIIVTSSDSGDVTKSVKVDLDIFSGIVVDSSLIYFGSKQDTITAFDYKNNRILWQRVMSSEVMSISKTNNNLIFIMTNDSKITAIDISTGKFVWINSQMPSELSIRGASTPIVYDDKVYVGFEDGKIISYNALNGDVVWEVQIPATKTETIIDRLNDIDGSVLIDEGIIFAISYQGSAVAIDGYSGKILWKKEASSINSLASNYENIIYINNEGVLVCLDKYTGRTKWKQNKFFKRLIGAPVFYNEYIIVSDIENYLHILDANTGSISGRIKIKNKIQSMYVDIDSIYMLDKDFSLKKINISNTE